MGALLVSAQASIAQPWADPLAGRMLLVHNRERAMVGVPPMRWDPELARSAAAYGPALAAAGRLIHSPRAIRPGQRENLAMIQHGLMPPEQLAQTWIAEKRLFVRGVYPNVSRTGSWLDVSHYSQMVWRTTDRLGCAFYVTARWDYLICRYSPPGNADGKPVY
ncbi:MAG: CAP domain-containing protein [Sphingomicrobium sp.]